MSLLGSDYPSSNECALSDLELKAWKLYCEDTAGGLHVVDFWHELSEDVKEFYLKRAG